MFQKKNLLLLPFFALQLGNCQQRNPTTAVILQSQFLFEEAPFAQCHAPTLVEMKNGNLMAAWFGGPYERHPDVSIYSSINTGTDWSAPKEIANGKVNDTLRYPTWNPVLFRNDQNKLLLFYKIGPSPSEWWGAYRSSSDGQTWSPEVLLPKGILGPIKNKPIQLPSGRIISPSSSEDGDIWKVHMEISDDQGQHWKKIPVDHHSPFKAIQPTLIIMPNNNIKALVRSDQNSILESISTNNGDTWSSLVKSEVKNPNSGIDAISLQNDGYLLVYNPTNSGKDWSDGRQKLYLAISDDGSHWSDLLILEDSEKGEFSYPAIIQGSEGLIHILYTYNREKIKYVKIKLK